MRRPVQTLTDAVATVAAYSTAVQLGLLDRIDREPAGPQDLARTCGADERGVRLLLAALEAGGFVQRLPDGRFQPALAGLASLHPIIRLWNHLPDAVRTGEPVPEVYPPPAALLGGIWGDTADLAVAALPEAQRVLDVAAGAPPWSIAYARRCPGSRVSVLDRAYVLPASRRAVASAGLADRFRFLPGDVLTADVEPGYDLILVPHLCHRLDDRACAAVLARLVPALVAGGTLAVIEPAAGGPGAAVHDLALYLRTSGGRIRPASSYVDWLAAAGLTGVAAVELRADLPTIVITGRRDPPAGTRR